MTKKILAFFILAYSHAYAQSNNWNLPVELNDSNAILKFELDSTWHVVYGATSNISGRIWLRDSNDYNSVSALVELPVSMFNTDNSSRDKKMCSVMEAEHFPKVTVLIENIENLCEPISIKTNNPCTAEATGQISIRDVKKSLSIPLVINKKDNKFVVPGFAEIRWADFGIKDPSIFIAHIANTVQIKFEVTL